MTRHISDHSSQISTKTRARKFLTVERRLNPKSPTSDIYRQSRDRGATRLRAFLRIARGWRT